MMNVNEVIIEKRADSVTVKCTGYNSFCGLGKVVASKPRAVVPVKMLQNHGGVQIDSCAFWTAAKAFMDAKRICSLCPRTIGHHLRVIHTR